MAFALTSFTADGERFMGPGPYRAIQTYIFTVTGLVGDEDFDLGDFSGTFWTEAQADTTLVESGITLGDMATEVLAQLTRNYPNYEYVKSVFVPQLFDRVAAAAASGTAYTQSLDGTTLLPIYTFDTNQGETAYTVIVQYVLKPNYLPVNLAYNVQV